MIQIADAVEIVLELARANILTSEECLGDDLKAEQQRQIEACNTLEDFTVNHLDDD